MNEDRALQQGQDITQETFGTIANAYQNVILRGDFLPNRNIERDIAEAQWERSPHGFPLYNPEKDVENTEMDDWYRPEH